jgi:hypothetical protein
MRCTIRTVEVMKTLIERRRLVMASLIAVAAVAIGVAAYASIPAPNGAITGCYTDRAVNNAHGLVVVDSAASCPAGTIPVSWNQTGPQGPAGPQGPMGQQGATGLAGPQGPSGFANVATTASLTPVSIVTSAWGTVDTVSISLTAPHTLQVTADMQGPATVGVIGSAERLVIDGNPIQSPDVACPAEHNLAGQLTYITPALYCSSGGRAMNWSASLAVGQHTIQSQVYFTSNGVGLSRSVTVHSLTVLDLGS